MKKINRTQDYIGKKFNRLTILDEVPRNNYIKMVSAECECGNIRVLSLSNILSGHTKSCGCYNLELSRNRGKTCNYKHGGYGTIEYKSWSHMISRCCCPTDCKYPSYGGRGIRVCDRWRHSFALFLEDMGFKPKTTNDKRGSYTIGRIDNDGDYLPENCRWELPKQQANNRSSCKLITIGELTLNRTQWVEKLGLNYGTVQSRLRAGWSEIDALITPVQTYTRKIMVHTNNEASRLPPQCSCKGPDSENLE